MAEIISPVEKTEEQRSVSFSPIPEPRKPAGRKKKKKAKRIIAIIVTLAILGGIGFGVWWIVFREKAAELGDALTAMIYRGSIQSMVTGGGQAMPKDSATITLSAGGTVQEVFVADGQQVMEGEPLYIIDSSAAVEAVEEAEKTVAAYKKELSDLQASYNDLVVRAEHGGILMDTLDLSVRNMVGAGTKIATLVDDSTLKLELYFSYAYENMIAKGQAATVSIPATMSELQGTVSEVNYVRRITPEGSVLFQVVITVSNPGSLTADMGASATLVSSGEEIYPYDAGALDFVRKTDVIAKAGGEVLRTALKDYAQVSSGQTLLELDAKTNDDATTAIENKIRTAEEALKKAQEGLDKFNAVSPMTGTVLSCTLIPGEMVEQGRVAITIANTSQMTVEARIDEMNVAYVKPGMYCDITQYGRDQVMTFPGFVESVSLEGKFENGMSYFPAIIKVDNPDGGLMSGMYVDYNLIASQSDDCLVAPVQAVKYTEMGTCVFLKADQRPDNAFDVAEMGIEIPDGFYAVPIVIGISDTYSVEILEGLEEGAEVFTQFMPSQGQGGYYGGGMVFYG